MLADHSLWSFTTSLINTGKKSDFFRTHPSSLPTFNTSLLLVLPLGHLLPPAASAANFADTSINAKSLTSFKKRWTNMRLSHIYGAPRGKHMYEISFWTSSSRTAAGCDKTAEKRPWAFLAAGRGYADASRPTGEGFPKSSVLAETTSVLSHRCDVESASPLPDDSNTWLVRLGNAKGLY